MSITRPGKGAGTATRASTIFAALAHAPGSAAKCIVKAGRRTVTHA